VAEPECTGIAASWCPNCGTCNCPRSEYGERNDDNPACPLHGAESRHAEAVCPDCGEIVAEDGARCDACEVKHLRAERDALRSVLRAAMLSHPLPWRVEHGRARVTATDGAAVAECATSEQAQDVVSLAERAAAEAAP